LPTFVCETRASPILVALVAGSLTAFLRGPGPGRVRPRPFPVFSDRHAAGPAGAFGGHDGRVAEYVLIRGGEETRLPAKTTVSVEAGDVVSYRTCGGGGYGPPEERDPERVLRDVLEEKVSVGRARDLYRVAVSGRVTVASWSNSGRWYCSPWHRLRNFPSPPAPRPG